MKNDNEPTMRFVLIGFGSVGRYHASVLAENDHDFAILDYKEEVRKAAKETYPESTVTADLSELDEEIDDWHEAVGIIATWAPSHASYFHELADRGVRRILCEKPLSNSLSAANEMCTRAETEGIRLIVNHLFRYSKMPEIIDDWAKEFELGPPVRFMCSGGAMGLVNNGVHFVDLAFILFDTIPVEVVSTANSDPINPRSETLNYYGGTAIFDFGENREAIFSFSNRSSVTQELRIDYRDAVIRVDESADVLIQHRDRDELEAHPSITRYGPPSEELYAASNPLAEENPYVGSNRTLFQRAHEDVLSESSPLSPGDTGESVLHACIGSLVAAEQRHSVSLPFTKEHNYWEHEWAYN